MCLEQDLTHKKYSVIDNYYHSENWVKYPRAQNPNSWLTEGTPWILLMPFLFHLWKDLVAQSESEKNSIFIF